MHGFTPKEILRIFNLYCINITDYDKRLALKMLSTMFTGKIKVKGLVKGEKLEQFLRHYLKTKKVIDISDISNNKIKLAIPTVDLNTGQVIYYLNSQVDNKCIYQEQFLDNTTLNIHSGNLAAIVRASCSFPAVFEPKCLDSRLLIDGGVKVNTPVSILNKMGCKKVLAIGFNKQMTNRYTNDLISVTLRTFDIMADEINKNEINRTDMYIEICMPNIGLLDFKYNLYLANKGYEETKKNLKRIIRMIEE